MFLKKNILPRKDKQPPWRGVGRSGLLLLDLPMELLFLIRDEVSCPSSDGKSCKNLRLVCRVFDKLFAPVVLSNMRIFNHSHNPAGPFTTQELSNFEQFCLLSRGSERTSYVRTITLDSWNWVYEPDVPFLPEFSRTKPPTWKSVLARSAHVIQDPKGVSQRIHAEKRRNEVKRHVESKNISFQLPNVQSVRWFVRASECEESVRLNIHILQTLSSLTDLRLSVPLDAGFMPFQIETKLDLGLSKLSNLHKITVRLWVGRSPRSRKLDWLKRVIANSPNLSELMLYQSGEHVQAPASLSELFGDVPPQHPLRLQRLRLSRRFYQLNETILPHIRSLNCLNVRLPHFGDVGPMDGIWDTLRGEKIFVSEIQINRITPPFLDYLRRFNHLTEFSLQYTGKGDQEDSVKQLLQILEHHALRRLRLDPFDGGRWFQHQASIMKFSHLQELVLRYRIEHSIVSVSSVSGAFRCADLVGDPVRSKPS
ncbi:hypothetical protein JOM56_006785 [Amanita muscaria]